MAGNNKQRHGHDDVYEAVTNPINSGVLVIPASGATNPGVQAIVPAGDAAKNVLGVTARRADPVGQQNLSGTDADGFPVVYPNPVNELTTVYKRCVATVTFTAVAVGFGVKLAAAANGQVRAWVAGDGADAIIGECRVVGGMGSAGGAGLAYIY